jgi:hypothetical protein
MRARRHVARDGDGCQGQGAREKDNLATLMMVSLMDIGPQFL